MAFNINRSTLCYLLCFFLTFSFVDSQVWGGIEDYLPNADIGECTCDLIYPHCDPNCCCDTACDEATQLLFTTCLDSGINENEYDFCVGEGEIVHTNWVDEYTLGGLLCIAVNNNPSLGKFYNVIDYVDSTEFEEISFFSYGTELTLPSDEGYVVGDPLRSLDNGLLPGYVSLLGPDTFGTCTDRNFARFMVNQEPQKCLKRVDTLDAAACSTTFSHDPYIEDLIFISDPLNSNTGDLIVSVNSVECTLSSGATVACSSTNLPNTVYSTNGTSGVCEYALREIYYHVLHNEGLISSVTADVVLGPVVNTFAEIIVGLDFVDDLVTLTVERSGNPGYIEEKPVLLGYLNNAGTNILLDPDLHRILGSDGNGDCDSSGGPWISFMQDVVDGCTISVDSTDFSGSSCISFSNQVASLVGVGSQPNRVAMFGDADPNNLDQWIEITEIEPPSGTCEIVREVIYDFMVARQGALANPQWKIVSARITYGTFLPASFSCYGQTCDFLTIPYEVRSIVNFVHYPEEGPHDFVPPASGGLPELPDDIFYPFKLHPSSSSSKLGANLVLMFVMCIFSLFSGLVSLF